MWELKRTDWHTNFCMIFLKKVFFILDTTHPKCLYRRAVACTSQNLSITLLYPASWHPLVTLTSRELDNMAQRKPSTQTNQDSDCGAPRQHPSTQTSRNSFTMMLRRHPEYIHQLVLGLLHYMGVISRTTNTPRSNHSTNLSIMHITPWVCVQVVSIFVCIVFRQRKYSIFQ